MFGRELTSRRGSRSISIPTARTPFSAARAASAATTRRERSRIRKTPLKSARRRACGNVDNANALPTVPQEEQKQKKRTFDALPKPGKLIRYRHILFHGTVLAHL